MRNQHHAYHDIQLNNDVLTATPHRQVQLLLEKCAQLMKLAQHAIAHREIANKHSAISRANNILRYLRACLNYKNPDAVNFSQQLDDLYVYMTQTLLQASLRNDPQPIEQAYVALTLIKEGWDAIA